MLNISAAGGFDVEADVGVCISNLGSSKFKILNFFRPL